MAHIDEMIPIFNNYEQEIQEITEKMEALAICTEVRCPCYLPRNRGRPKQCLTDEEKANR